MTRVDVAGRRHSPCTVDDWLSVLVRPFGRVDHQEIERHRVGFELQPELLAQRGHQPGRGVVGRGLDAVGRPTELYVLEAGESRMFTHRASGRYLVRDPIEGHASSADQAVEILKVAPFYLAVGGGLRQRRTERALAQRSQRVDWRRTHLDVGA